MNLYVICCCETDEDNTAIGRRDPCLSKIGLERSKSLAEELAQIPFVTVYTSPALRTFSTGLDIVAHQKNEDCSLIAEGALNEINYGDLTGVHNNDTDYIYHSAEPFMRFPNGESLLDIVARVYPFLTKLKDIHNQHNNIAIVTHNDIIKVIATYCCDFHDDEFRYRLHYEPGQILKFSL